MENVMVSQRKPMSTRFLLIVGENEATWKGLQKAIKQEARYLTLVAQTSEEAIHFARNIQPSLVLIPYHLPDLNGMELYHRLKTIAPEKALPAIMIMKEGEKVRHEHLPELHLLEEPYSLDMLLQLLKHLSKG
ncbi:hypothetical protein KSD_21700 [Ktedonobacter sp. SOSP1-85]|nr:hypothetical protein KSD_21700 [Ktedonobacter sp. SOSP1-85]